MLEMAADAEMILSAPTADNTAACSPKSRFLLVNEKQRLLRRRHGSPSSRG